MAVITVKPTEFFELPVSFKPTEIRKYKDSIIVFSNATKQDSVILLEGEGIDSTIGVRDNFDDTVFEIIPNPAGDYIEINFERFPTFVRCRTTEKIIVYNVLGECVKSPQPQPFSQSEKGVIKVDVSDMPPGVYYLIVGNEIKMFVKL
jgi:hypothetical protein